jgi:hypothetical protein
MKQAERLSRTLECHLSAYALAASAAGVGMLALTQPTEAKIVYTPDHHKLTHGHQSGIDLNHDGVTDFVVTIKSQYWSSMCTFCAQYMTVNGNGNAGASVIGTWIDAAALKKGAVIGPGDPFQKIRNSARLMASGFNDNNSFFYTEGLFANKKDRFLGVKFRISGRVHYGWVRFSKVTVSFENGVAPLVTGVLTGYAYETISNKPIIAGKTHGKDVVYARPATLGHLAAGSAALSTWRYQGGANK